MPCSLLLCALLLANPPDPAGPEALDEAQIWVEAAKLEQAGDYAEAAELFAPLAEAYPQDYATQLQAAWLAFLAGDDEQAERRYAIAVELSEGAPLARSGLAWTHLRRGERRRARREFEAVLAEYPGFESAEEGLEELRRRRFSIAPRVLGVGHVYAGHPSLDWAAGLSAAAPMVIAEHLVLSPGYRYAHFLLRGRERGRRGRRSNPGGRFDQHEAHFGVGGTWPEAGFLAQYAYLDDGSTDHNHAHVVGLSLRYSPWGDGFVSGNAAAFRSGWVGRVAPSWRMPATDWLDVQPGFALQFANREVLPSGFASLVVHGRPGELVIGGKGGLEERPVYLETPVIFAFAGRILWGAWLGGRLHLGRGVSLQASYETHRLRAPTESGGVAPTQMHFIALGLSFQQPPDS